MRKFRSARLLGYIAGTDGKPSTDCPYWTHMLRAEWLRGWDAAKAECDREVIMDRAEKIEVTP